MTKHFSWEPPVSADSSYLRLRRFSFSSITGFLPFLVKIGPWLLCSSEQTIDVKMQDYKVFTTESQISHFFPLSEGARVKVNLQSEKEWEGGTEVHTSSDVVEAVEELFTASPSTSPLDSSLGSEPVGRPRSCRTCERQTSKHEMTCQHS